MSLTKPTRDLWCLLVWLTLNTTIVAGEDLPCVLELRNGNFVRGTLGTINNDEVTWNSEHFAAPLTFPRSNVDGLKFAPVGKQPESTAKFLIELSNRDTFYADILEIGSDGMKVDSPAFGIATLRLDAVRRISRNGPQMQVYPVPTRLDGWKTSKPSHWRSEGTTCVTDDSMASLYADVGLPEKALIEMEFSWEKSPKSAKPPSFSIYLGTDETRNARKKAFSIEVWDSNAIVQRQTKDDGDLASLQGIQGAGSMHVFAYLDQAKEHLIMYDGSGKLLADLEVPSNKWRASGLMFLNRNGRFRLNYVQVRGWSGAKPSKLSEQRVSVVTKTETLGANEMALTDEMVSLTTDDDAKELPLDEVLQIDFPAIPSNAKSDAVAGFRDGSRLSGQLVSATETTLRVRSDVCDEVWELPVNSLRGFALRHEGELDSFKKSAPTGFRYGKLELMDTRLNGWLVDGESKGKSGSCLVWQPALSSNASPLVTRAFGRIVYREAPAPVVAKPNNAAQAQIMFGFRGVRRVNKPKTANKVVKEKSSRAVHLRSGDVIPCTVKGIDEQGIRIESKMTESKLLRHDQVKAAQLIDNAPIPLLTQAKRDRLLTLPRMQRNSPPSHLLFSSTGDVLRGSLLTLSDEQLEMEVRLNPHEIPRDRVATIIWLHEDEIDAEGVGLVDGNRAEDDEASTDSDSQNEMMVQVVRNAGTRFSFVAESFKDQTIWGTSEVLKSMHAKVDDVDRLLIGDFIKGNAKTLKFGRWHLTSATDPKFVTADEDSPSDTETTPGTESLLVGKPAPNVRLKMLDGKTDFSLAEHRGHCVVLDFWATWCGPCLQVMPVVEEVVAEFEPHGVELFAVNLQERPAEIKATLDRRQLDVPVVLDRDGAAAARYEANAIPQTVVIAPDGTVARVFVGNSRKFEDQLRAALTELTAQPGE